MVRPAFSPRSMSTTARGTRVATQMVALCRRSSDGAAPISTRTSRSPLASDTGTSPALPARSRAMAASSPSRSEPTISVRPLITAWGV
jgi:hypothetical protein